ncbi:hypothetical protein Tco_1056582, partial [Tanacetum coccineum]
PGYSVAISLVLALPLGAVLPKVAWSPTLKANDGIGICPLGSLVVVVTVVVAVVVVIGCCYLQLQAGSYSPWPGGQASCSYCMLVYKDCNG